jgi:hypothetical protein
VTSPKKTSEDFPTSMSVLANPLNTVYQYLSAVGKTSDGHLPGP